MSAPDLFSSAEGDPGAGPTAVPLAVRMRPTTLAQVRGQREVLTTGSPLRRLIEGGGGRAGPVSAPVSRPDAGSTTCAPRALRVATLAWVAGCNHISVCIAGANTTGQRAVSKVAVSRSSA